MYKQLTFCMMSISSGLRSRSIEEMLSMLFFRTIPAANGFAMTPGDAWANNREEKHAWVFGVSFLCAVPQFQLNIYLHACDGSRVEAITHQHDQGISCGTQDPDCLRMSHAEETVIAHLQDSHTHLQAAVSCCSTTAAHLHSTDTRYALSYHPNKHELHSKIFQYKLYIVFTLEMKMPSSVGSKGLPACPLAPPRMLMPSFSPGCLWMTISYTHCDHRGLVSTVSSFLLRVL